MANFTEGVAISLYQIIVLAIIQGVTEFLPISSSAHLIFLPKVIGWQDQGISIDVAVHFGTLGAVMAYFYRDVISMMKGGVKLLGGTISSGGDLFLKLVIATIPVVIAGAIVNGLGDDIGRKIEIIGWASLGFGILLYLVDVYAPTKHTLQQMTYTKSLFIGIIQTFALIPGASRAGACITALRFLGFNRAEAAHYSCLMSMPTIFAAATLIGYQLITSGKLDMCVEALLAALLSFITSFISILFMMRWVQNANFGIFVLYRVALGIALLAWVYF